MYKCKSCGLCYSECCRYDLKLIQPFNTTRLSVPMGYRYRPLSRIEIAIKYMTGAYNEEEDKFYDFVTWKLRDEYDAYILLPDCVFENYPKLKNPIRDKVIALNLINLPIDEEYINIITDSPNTFSQF